MLIAFVAPKQSGKTTACTILKDYWGADNVAQVNFKDGLIAEIKEKFPDLLREIALIYGHIQEGDALTSEIVDDLFISKPPLIRALLQNYGTEVRRGDNDDYWVEKWLSTVGMIADKHVLCDDVRFLNEADAVDHFDGILIRITRTDLQSTDTHQSETEQASISCVHEIVLGYGEQDKLKEELIKIVKLYE
jgi:hypothetical protein